ncbi:MAG: ATP-binding protein [Candidatus Dormibacteria bacterium]
MTAWLRQTRVRLALAYSGLFSLVALVAALGFSLAIARAEYAAIDDSLSAASASIQGTLAAGGGLPGSGALHDASGAPGGGGIASFLFDAGGRLLESAGQGPPASAIALIVRQAATTNSVITVTTVVGGTPQRVRAIPLHAQPQDTRVLAVTRSRAEADQVVATTGTVVVLGMLVLIVAASVLGYGLAGTALRPVREIVTAARALSEQDLHRRITLDLPPDELGQLADTFNSMLARLETAFDSLGRFTADAAHELRAPLTLIRTEAEVTLSRPRSAKQYQASLAAILAEARRLGRMADQLLMLARAEAGALVTQMSDVDAAALVAETARIWQPLATERGLVVAGNAGTGAPLRGDADLLRRLLDNLIDNALRHAPSGSTVEVGARQVGRVWEVSVSDTGPGVPEAARASIFERFSRADQSRTRQTGGAGLGLALCAAIAQLHNGSVRLEDGPGPGARFVVTLPVAPTEDGRPRSGPPANVRPVRA